MGVKHWVRAILVLSTIPSAAWALGLGDIRLKSALNAPLEAEIEVVNASAEELAGLRAQLATRETFARYGLEWPAFLNSVTLAKGKDAEGRDVLRLRSNDAITEPFVTLLVDANWGRGRLVREYTVLLDPPVFSSTPAPSAAVQAPQTAAPRSGAVERPAAVPSAAATADASEPAGGGSPLPDQADSYQVRRGETLTGIAARYAAGSDLSLEQAMVSLYRSNAAAFDGSMNRMRAGAVLRVDPVGMAAISRQSAVAEVRRQRAEWRNKAVAAGGSAGASEEGRLRLVPPSRLASPGAGGSAGSAADADTAATRARVAQLEQELADARRLIDLRANEIAQLQQRLAGQSAESGAPVAPTASTPAAGTTVSEAPRAESEAADAGAAPTPAEPVSPSASAEAPAAEVAPSATPAAEPVAARPVQDDAAQAEEEPSLVATILALLREFWFVPVGLLALLGGLFGYRRWKAGREDSLADLGETTTVPRPELSMPPPATAPAASGDTARLRRPIVSGEDERNSFLVEEGNQAAGRSRGDGGGAIAPAAVAAAVGAAARASTLGDQTLSGDTGLNLDQGDPLAEADFHMAYGLYDQAADLVKLSIGREPERRDLKLKLAEVYFVWGNKDEFLRTVRDLEQTSARGAPGEWEKIVIMGRQIAPEDPLFAPGASAGKGLAAVDLPLSNDGGDDVALDFEVVGDETSAGRRSQTVTDIDTARPGNSPMFDIGAAAQSRSADGSGGTTREMAPRFAASAGGAAAARAADEYAPGALDIDLGESPTVEQPAIRDAGSPTIREKLDAAMRHNGAANEQTAELALDDLNLEVGGNVAHLDRADAPESPTTIAEIDEELQRYLDRDNAATGVASDDAGATVAVEGLTELAPALPEHDAARSRAGRSNGLDLDLSEAAGNRSGDTSIVTALEPDAFSMDFELPLLDSTAAAPAQPRGGGLDLNLGTQTMPELVTTARTAGARTEAEPVLAPLEPVTISEVGTKLDLARAYMDMGDPDGARSILKEVLHEGSVSQKQEAQRLVASLPG